MKSFHSHILILTALMLFLIASYSHAQTQRPLTSQRCNVFTFDASASHDPDNENISFFWDFGDGQSSTEPVIEHTYSEAGIYDVTLSIADNSGLECSTAITTQKVKVDIPPTINLQGYKPKVCVDELLEMDASKSFINSDNKLKFSWNFGDGSKIVTSPIVTKVYEKGGSYKLRLKVDTQSDSVCSTKTLEKIVQVNAPPIAEAGDEEVLVCIGEDRDRSVKFDASGSMDVNNDSLNYIWDFGDGRKATGPKVTHTYRELGNFDVQLIVDDNSDMACNTGVDFVTVRLNKAPKAEAGSDVVACPGDEILFDGTESYALKKGTLSGFWSFGDGSTANGLKTSHSYTKPGKYEARLTVKNELNAMCPASNDSKTVTINARPTVTINAPKAICLGNIINFDASSAADPDGDTLEYYWSFGDGTVLRSGSKVSHEYKTGGIYKVSVIVDDGRGNPCSTATANMKIKVNTPPIADAGPNLTCCVDRAASFDGTASRDPDSDRLSYYWDFGDGTTSQGAVVTHTYSNNGSYNVKLTVDDNSGTVCSQSTSGFVASANAKPIPVLKIR